MHAKSHTQLAIGVPTYLTGVAGVIVGIAVLSGPVGWVRDWYWALAAGTGLGFMGSGVTHCRRRGEHPQRRPPTAIQRYCLDSAGPPRRALAVPFELKEAMLHLH